MTENKIRSAFSTDPIIRSEVIARIKDTAKLYVIFITPRSGSTWLTERAAASGELGVPQEWFNDGFVHDDIIHLGCRPPRCIVGASDINVYAEKVVAAYKSDNGVMGLEMSRYQTEWMCELIERPQHIMTNVVPFYLRRKNLVAQAISLYRSAQSGYFHSYQSAGREIFDALNYEADAIMNWCTFLVDNEEWFEAFFASKAIRPFRFFYEDILQDMSGVLEWMRRRITNAHGSIQHGPEQGLVQIISDEKNRAWESQIRQDRGPALAGLAARRPPLLDEGSDCAGFCGSPAG